MSDFEFPIFQQPTEDARALLTRLYREIGVSAVAAALAQDFSQGFSRQEGPRAEASLTLQANGGQVRAA